MRNLLLAAGTSSAGVLLKAPSASAAGMAESVSSLSADIGGIAALHYNPAAPAFLRHTELSLMGQRGLIEDTFTSAFLGVRTNWGTYSGNFSYYSLGNIELIDSLGQSRTVKAEEDLVFNLNYSEHLYDKYATGISLKILQHKLVENLSSNAIAMDLGAQAKILNKMILLGVSAQNIGSKLTFVDISEALPIVVRGGIAYHKTEHVKGWTSILIGIDFVQEINQSLKEFLGLEVFWSDLIAFRLGYKFGQEAGKLSTGLGFVMNNFQLDYAFTDGSGLGSLHSASFSYKFWMGRTERRIRQNRATREER
ncbi:MAG: PorV/PorQ family protein [Elusimicrobia bacterium]|nr:PorV/PorQ family protein [Elusimicrobiota bacterium]